MHGATRLKHRLILIIPLLLLFLLLYLFQICPDFKVCIPTVTTTVINNALAHYNLSATAYTTSGITQSGSWFQSFVSDVLEQRGIIFGFGLGVSSGFAALYTYILRIPGVLTITIWSCLLSVQVIKKKDNNIKYHLLSYLFIY